MANDSNATGSHGGHGGSAPTPILFIFFTCALGAFVRTILKQLRLPYTVLLMALGCVIGEITRNVPEMEKYTTLANMDPHTILHVFLPILIFESAFAMEVHTFFKSFLQIVILAIPGLALASFMTCVFSMHVFSYGWSWEVGMMFGAIISATDPVAVVALLKDLGASKQLGIIIEGESLLNDGAAIVLFSVFESLSVPGSKNSGTDILIFFIRVTFGGPAFGFLMGKLTTFWLVNIFNDALTEITITLCSTYLTFYIGEVFLQVSGVLAVVVLGVTVSAERTSISPEVEAFLHRFWEMLAYLANTLIFILVGIVITKTAVHNSDLQDWFLLAALYCSVFVIRGMIIALFSPLLARIGYGLDWRSATVMTWGGLRGAVGLALGLKVMDNLEIDPTGVTQTKILLHCAGIVMLTLLINATTISSLLRILGMSEISIPKRLAMASAVRNLRDVATTCINSYKTDRFLADADWDIVTKYIEINDPYKTTTEEAAMDDLTNFHRTSLCPKCDTNVPNEPSAQEWSDMHNEARLRLLKAEKTSYWKQFEHGMLSREAVRRLVECVDHAADKPRTFIDTDEIKKNWQVGGMYVYLMKRLEMWVHTKIDTEAVEWPENKILRGALAICLHSSFDIFLYVVILLNVVFVIMELVVESTYCSADMESTFGSMFDILNYIFITIYVFEAAIKLMAYRIDYFKNKWNLFDFIVLVLSLADLVMEFTLFKDARDGKSCGEDEGGIGNVFNPSVLKIAKIVRLLRLLRSLRLVKGLIPQAIDFVNHQINKKLRLGYDVGKGYITGEEDVYNFIDHMIDNRKVARELKDNLMHGRLEIMKELGLLQKNNPGIAVSIKTQQAARRVLNNVREKIASLRGEGVLDEMESEKLEIMIEMRIKKILKIPATIHPPPPEKIICNLSWISGDPYLVDYIKQNACLVTMQEGEELDVESNPHGGIYVIISGLVKIDKVVEDYQPVQKENLNIRRKTIGKTDNCLLVDLKPQEVTIEKVSDYLSTGSVLGEFSLLTGKPSSATITCDTSLQMYHIPYEAIQSAIEMFTDAPSLEYRLWRVAASRIAVPILKKQFHYRSWSFEKIRMCLEKCVLFMKKWELLDGGRLNVFSFDLRAIYMSDVVMIHGYAENAETGEQYQGPCYIPQNINTLNLLPGRTEKHILIILSRDLTLHLDEEHHEAEEEDPQKALKSAMDRSTIAAPSTATPVVRSGERNSSLCLLHASHERFVLEDTISDQRDAQLEKKHSLARKVSSMIGTRSQMFPQSNHDIELPTVREKDSKKFSVLKDTRGKKISPLNPLPQPSKPSPDSSATRSPLPTVQTQPKVPTSTVKSAVTFSQQSPTSAPTTATQPVAPPSASQVPPAKPVNRSPVGGDPSKLSDKSKLLQTMSVDSPGQSLPPVEQPGYKYGSGTDKSNQ